MIVSLTDMGIPMSCMNLMGLRGVTKLPWTGLLTQALIVMHLLDMASQKLESEPGIRESPDCVMARIVSRFFRAL